MWTASGDTMPDAEMLRDELDRVLSSACFARSERLSQLLRFLVERYMEGRGSELKESVIGVEVFGRRPDYDPKLDSTVRTEAVRLRARLDRYYATDGAQDPLVIELPKGGYVPRVRQPAAMCGVQRASPKQLWLAVVLAVFVVAATPTGVWWALYKTAPIPIAVLPLVNLSQDPDNEYFADGLTDELIRNLSIIDGLTVRSQTSSFALKGKPRNVHEAGTQLEVDYIVEGSVARNEQHLRINAQLVRVRDDVPVWSGKFDRELTDVFAIQDEISRGIVNSLRLKLGHGRRRYETSVEAYDLYLQARALQNRRPIVEVIDLFEKAIGKDSSFAPAYAGLAAFYAVRSSDNGPPDALDETLTKMRAAAEKAIQLDPLLAEAHSALGIAYARDGQWDLAERSLRRAIEIAPNVASTHSAYVNSVLFPLGRIEEAVQELRISVRNNPLSPQAHDLLADALLSAGRYDEAARECEMLPAGYRGRSLCLARTWQLQGRATDAVRLLLAEPPPTWGWMAYAYAKAGRHSEAETLMAEAPTRYPRNRGPWQYALAFAGFGDKDRTIEQLERWATIRRVGPLRFGLTLNRAEFAFVRDDPRVKALRKNVGLP